MKEQTKTGIIKGLTFIFQLLTGGTFIFSGFVKGVDPWGTLYKFEEYLSAMHIPVMHSLIVAGVFGLCVLEFLTGVALVLRCYRRSAPLVAAAFMIVMLPLTLWIALTDPVSDCGCFGDALVIGNWETFWKNVALAVMTAWLIKYNRVLPAVITPAFQWIGVVITIAFIGAVSLAGYIWQPLMDFRPYPQGGALTGEEDGDDTDGFRFVYEKDGERREFGINDELPSEDDGWQFVERRETAVEAQPDGTEEKTFRIWSRDGENDVTDEVITGTGTEILLLISRMATISPATTWRINAVNEWAERQGGLMIAVVDGNSEQIRDWEEMALPEYEIFTADDTAIKEVARGNPAVLKLKDGKIEWKSTLLSLDVEEMNSKGANFKPSEIITDGHGTLMNLLWIYVICMAVPVTLSILPNLKKLYHVNNRLKRKRKLKHGASKIIHDDKAPREESCAPGKAAQQKTDAPSHD